MGKDVKKLLKLMLEKNASDLHITANSPIHFRVDEKLLPFEEELSPEEAKETVYSLLKPAQKEQFEKDKELDFSFEVKDLARFRVNVFYQRGCVGCAIRLIPFEIWDFDKCGIPKELALEICKKPKGLILVTGATGSGKSTTLASMVDYINSTKQNHIMTIEDPIEFVYRNKKSIVNQREVYSDTNSFGNALKHVLRQDPNIILIGEMRDLETIESALIIAETGHLVFATLHTSDASQTINRVVDVFPAHQQQQIRTQLSFVLLAVFSQQLIPHSSGKGRVLATEVLMSNPAVKSLIREGKIHQIYSTIQTSQKEHMRTMNQSLADLCKKGLITKEEAFSKSMYPDELKRLMGSEK